MVTTQQIASEYDLGNPHDIDIAITGYGSKVKKGPDLIQWAKNAKFLAQIEQGAVVCSASDFDILEHPHPEVCYLTTAGKPRLVFAKILTEYFTPSTDIDVINDVERHRKNPNLKIADNVFIAEGVEIGDGTVIHSGVVIHTNTRIGQSCVLKANCSIATEGLGLELDRETDLLFKFPQLGGVVLGDHVEVGPSSTIRRSALDHTIIHRGTKLGSMVNIGHNCQVGENNIFTCNIIMSGSSRVGDQCFIGVGVLIREGLSVGSDVTLGMGAILTKDVPDGETWVGNPAKPLKNI